MTVSDTSPIINLAAIGQLNLLQALYGTVHIPRAVYREITAGGALPGAESVQTQDWIVRRPCENEKLITLLHAEVDRGEAEAIALALETDAQLLIDEKKGRRLARRLGVSRIGLLGIVIEAKEHTLITAVDPLLRALRQEAGFWISDVLHERVLRMAGET